MAIFVNKMFMYPLTILELINPMICSSLILLFLMIYMALYIKTRRLEYLIVFLVSILIYTYEILVLLTLSYGAIMGNISLAMQLNRAANIVLLFAFVFIPLNTINFLKANKIAAVMNIISFIVTVIFTIIVIVSIIIYPDAFISVTKESYNAVNQIRQSSIGTGATGILYTYFQYLILAIFTVSFLSTGIDIFLNMSFQRNILILIGTAISLFLVSEDIFNLSIIKNLYFNKTVLAITIFAIPRAMTIFTTFAYTALEAIQEQNKLQNKLKSNSEIIKEVKNISDKLNQIDKNLMDNSMTVFEIIKENRDAFNIISEKIENVQKSNYEFLSSKEIKEDMVKQGNQSVKYMFEYFDKSRMQISENFRILMQTISNIIETDFSNSELMNISKNLRDISSYLKTMSENTFQNITKSMSQFKEVNNITESIYETISFVKEISNKTNILSINAGIQASKAGILGKSFAVVAKEIGTLAFQSSKGTDQVEKMLTDIFAGLVAIENSSYTIEDHAKQFGKEVKSITKEIDNLANIIEDHVKIDSQKLVGLKPLEKYNDTISSITINQNSIISNTKDNITAIFNVQNNLGLRIEGQRQDIMKIHDNISNLIKIKDELEKLTIKIGSYSAAMHTDIESLGSIISTHISKSSMDIFDKEKMAEDTK